MPIMTDDELHGFQIWINQPAKDKMNPAQYYDFQPETITEHLISEHNLIRVIAGSLQVDENNISGPLLETGVPLLVADWQAKSGAQISITLEPQFQSMVYIYKGQVSIEGTAIKAGQLAHLDEGELLDIMASQDSGMLLLAGQKIEEKIVHYGPFVMNSEQEIEQAIHDYNAGLFKTY
jgi:redox-sensitive bicupin YhaK (pirin superfamily)